MTLYQGFEDPEVVSPLAKRSLENMGAIGMVLLFLNIPTSHRIISALKAS